MELTWGEAYIASMALFVLVANRARPCLLDLLDGPKHVLEAT